MHKKKHSYRLQQHYIDQKYKVETHYKELSKLKLLNTSSLTRFIYITEQALGFSSLNNDTYLISTAFGLGIAWGALRTNPDGAFLS
jgi:hypothetical protein